MLQSADREPLEATAMETQGEPSGVEAVAALFVATSAAANVVRAVAVCLAVVVVAREAVLHLVALSLAVQTVELVADTFKAPPDLLGLVLAERRAEQPEPQARQELMQEPRIQADAAVVAVVQEPQLAALVALAVYQAEAAVVVEWAGLPARLVALEGMAA